MSDVSKAIDKLGPTGQEINTLAAVIAPAVKQQTAQIVTQAVTKAAATHLPANVTAHKSFLQELLHLLGLE